MQADVIAQVFAAVLGFHADPVEVSHSELLSVDGDSMIDSSRDADQFLAEFEENYLIGFEGRAAGVKLFKLVGRGVRLEDGILRFDPTQLVPGLVGVGGVSFR